MLFQTSPSEEILPDVVTLQSLQPDMEAISAITKKHDAVSFHVFAFGNDGYTAHVRDFAPLYDIPEESATGTANASLIYYLQQCGCLGKEAECAFLQGEAMGRPSVVATRIQADGNIFVGGTAKVLGCYFCIFAAKIYYEPRRMFDLRGAAGVS